MRKIGNIGIIANFVFLKIYNFISLFTTYDVGKCELRCQLVYWDYIVRLLTSLFMFFSNGTAKMKLAILAFLYCKEFVKNSIMM